MNLASNLSKRPILKLAAPLVITVAIVASAALGVASVSADQPPEPGPPEHARNDDKPCLDEIRDVPGQGPSCRVADGLWKVHLGGGRSMLTHGPDAAMPGTIYGALSPNAVARQPVCGGSTYMRAILARPTFPAGTAGVGDKTADQFRQDIKVADGLFFDSAVESGSPNGAHLRFMCDSTGQVRVDVLTLRAPTIAEGRYNWGLIINMILAQIDERLTEKYAVYFDGPMPGLCGQGSVESDSTDSAANINNGTTIGPDFAFSYDCGPAALLHEMGHTLGAVQPTAPHATGVNGPNNNGYHCWEDLDYMCYNDGADTDPGTIEVNCPYFIHFDCNHDDYFDAKIGAGQGGAAGSYLDTNYNIGECYVTWIVNGACDTTPPTPTSPWQAFTTGTTLNSCTGTPPNGIPTRIQWYASDIFGISQYRLESYSGGVWSYVSLPRWTDTSITLNLTPDVPRQFRIKARDTNGNWSGWATGSTFTPRLSQETAAAYTGTWIGESSSVCNFSGYDDRFARAAGATASFTFTGRSVAWVASKGPGMGRAQVYLDGVLNRTVDLYSATTSDRNLVFNGFWATSGTHTVRIVVEGTAGRPGVTVDAFTVLQ